MTQTIDQRLKEALDAASSLMEVARRYFPKSIKNHDRFQLENTCATIGKVKADWDQYTESRPMALDSRELATVPHNGASLPEDVRDFLANLSYRAADETPNTIAEDASDLLGKYDEEAHKANLLDRARALQAAFWDVLGDLERVLGIDIDSTCDLEGMTIEDLIGDDDAECVHCGRTLSDHGGPDHRCMKNPDAPLLDRVLLDTTFEAARHQTCDELDCEICNPEKQDDYDRSHHRSQLRGRVPDVCPARCHCSQEEGLNVPPTAL